MDIFVILMIFVVPPFGAFSLCLLSHTRMPLAYRPALRFAKVGSFG